MHSFPNTVHTRLMYLLDDVAVVSCLNLLSSETHGDLRLPTQRCQQGVNKIITVHVELVDDAFRH